MLTFTPPLSLVSHPQLRYLNVSPQITSPSLQSRRAVSLQRRPRTTICANVEINWPDLSSRAQTILSTLPSTTQPNYKSRLHDCVFLDRQNPFLWFALAKHVANEEDNTTAAFSILEKATQEVPVGCRGGLYELWSNLLVRQGEEVKAMKMLTNAIETDAYGPLFVILGSIQMRRGDEAASRATLKRGSEEFGNHAAIWRAWATLESRSGDLKRGLELWKTAVERGKRNGRAWYMLAQHVEWVERKLDRVAETLYKGLEYCEDDKNLRMYLARIEERRGRYEEAIEILKEAEEDERVLRMLGRMMGQNGDMEGARQVFERVKSVEGKHAWAVLEMRMGSRQVAKRILKSVLSEGDGGVWRAWGEIKGAEGEYEEAREAFQKALRIVQGDWRVILAWGKMEIGGGGDLKKGKELIEKIVTEGEGGTMPRKIWAEGLRERGLLAGREGDRQEAIKMFRKAVEVEPEYAGGWRLMAQEMRGESVREVYKEALTKIGRLAHAQILHWWGVEEKVAGNIQGARELFIRATVANRSYMSAWMSWALMEKSLGGMQQARDIFRQAGKIIETERIRAPYIYMAWARVEEDLGGVNEAAQVLQRACELVSEDGGLWAAWGGVEERRGRIEEARELYKRGVECGGGGCWFLWGVLEMKMGRVEEAVRLFREGCSREGENAGMLVVWGGLEGKMGRIDASRELFKRATKVDPYYERAWVLWAELEKKVGNLGMAEELLQRGRELDRQIVKLG